MASIKSIITSSVLLLATPLARALPQPQATSGQDIADMLEDITEDMTEGMPEEIGDAVDGVVSSLATILSNPDATDIVPNRYVVVYNNTFDDDTIDTKEADFSATLAKRNIGKRSLDGSMLSTSLHSFRMSGWRAMVLDADDDFITQIYNSDEVAYVEADQRVQATALLEQSNSPPGLNRLSQLSPDQETYVFDGSAGAGITAYVVDTGILTSHSEFEGRATFGANFIDDVDTDENGHGSHVAGTIGGITFGVAKKADLVAVKVLGGDGGGSNSGVLDGMQWIINDVEEKGLAGRAVMNMSLGGQFSQAINRAIQAMFEAGIVCVVAAGNENQDTDNTSPGSAPNAITVGAIDALNDQRAEFSNFGPSVDIYAAGVEVESVGIRSNTDVTSLSGTSMASPHVAGLAAYLMSFQGIEDPAEVAELITNLATRAGGEVGSNAPDTTSLIANNGNTYAG